jgi:hypothetical protein
MVGRSNKGAAMRLCGIRQLRINLLFFVRHIFVADYTLTEKGFRSIPGP